MKAPPPQKAAATISDVALRAGVSKMTVSRVINQRDNVHPRTRRAVEDAIAALNFVPSAVARNLAGIGRVRIGILYSIPSAAYLSDFLVGSMNEASATPLQFVVEKCPSPKAAEEAAARMIAAGIDGVIVSPPICDSAAVLDLLARNNVAAVGVATGGPIEKASSISIDDYQAAYAMTEHIIRLGHQRIGFIKGDPAHSATNRRLRGYTQALGDAGLPLDERLVAEGLFTYRSGLDAAETLLRCPEPPTAIFASNDDMAAAAIAIANQHGLEVPADLTVCGFDDTSIATTIWPELTTIHQSIKEMAHAAMELLVDIVRTNGQARHRHVRFDYQLVRRQSDAVSRLRPRSQNAPVSSPPSSPDAIDIARPRRIPY